MASRKKDDQPDQVVITGKGPGGAVPVTAEVGGPVTVRLRPSESAASDDQAFWVAIRNRSNALQFKHYDRFIRCVFHEPEEGSSPAVQELRSRTAGGTEHRQHGVDAYQLLKAATEIFLILNCGVVRESDGKRRGSIFIDRCAYDPTEENERLGRRLTFDEVKASLEGYLDKGLPYIRRVLDSLTPEEAERLESGYPAGDTLIGADSFDPCLLELIWSYWHEEGMLVHAVNSVSMRFQNKRPRDGNPLAHLELSPLRPLSNFLWGYIQDEPFRLTATRRSYEYSHHYGLSLVGKAVPALRPADHRSKFLEAFHSLLRQVAIFYKEDADTTVIADGFPILNSLKEVHMLLAEGAHNQFRDLPWTARMEMLIQQWLLSRREMREFLHGRQMVPYKEAWMGQVDSLWRLLGWGDTPVTHFHDLGVYGEQVLLSIRYGDWVAVNGQDRAKNWARYWRPEIQAYIHAYRAVTGASLGDGDQAKPKVDATPPSILLQRRAAQQRGW